MDEGNPKAGCITLLAIVTVSLALVAWKFAVQVSLDQPIRVGQLIGVALFIVFSVAAVMKQSWGRWGLTIMLALGGILGIIGTVTLVAAERRAAATVNAGLTAVILGLAGLLGCSQHISDYIDD